MFRLKLLVVAVLAVGLTTFAFAQTKPVERPGAEILAEGIVALLVGPFAIMYATGTGVFQANKAAGYESVCTAIQGKWINGMCVGGNWLNVLGWKQK